ncbi:MAG: Crp/Fnr family transcriptional regulator [Sphingomonadales bacterium]|nr:Crp/Fnr family transcriptional regulator [Sphingomonadales bacterium]
MPEFTEAECATIAIAFGCGEALLRVIATAARPVGHARGRSIQTSEDDADRTVLLLAGRAHELAYGLDGGAVVLQELGPGDLFGSLLAASGSEDQMEVVPLTDLRGAGFSQVTLLHLMESYSCIALAIARQLSARLRTMRQRMAETVLLSATGRICAELARRADASGEGVVRPIPVFVEFALVAQTTRETVSRTVSQLEKRGIIVREADALRVVAPHRLAEMIH